MNIPRRNIVLLGMMASSAGLAAAIRPTVKMADAKDAVKLEALIPKDFGEWRLDTAASAMVVNPQQQAFLDTIYSQTLSRTYIHASGRRIMLSLAYGGDQSHDTQIHKPEVCYPAQGFRLVSTRRDVVNTSLGNIPVMRVVTELGQRHEPVTYWIRVGDALVSGAVAQNLARIRLGMQGIIPDGILFRISEISRDTTDSYTFQDQFIRDTLQAMEPRNQAALVGNLQLAA